MALTAGEHIARPISMNLAGLNVDEGGTMTDAEARKAVRKNLLHGMMLPMLLMGLATAGLFYEVRGLRSVRHDAAVLAFAFAGLVFNAALMVALPKFRDAFWWPPSTAPQMLFPRIARSRP